VKESEREYNHALARHGGIWMDASIICMKPFREWLDHTKEFVGYHIGGTTKPYPVIENWFFACRPGCEFMQAWCKEFSRLGDFPSVQEYLQDLRASGVDLSNVHVHMQEYLAMHCAAQRVMQKLVPLSSRDPSCT